MADYTNKNLSKENIDELLEKTKGYVDDVASGKQDKLTAGNGISISAGNVISADTPTEISYLTTAPSADNTSGNLKIVVLSSEPATKYNGYIYFITES